MNVSRRHFTEKERDTESGNDYLEARYYSSNLGRFMSPDWSAKEEPVPYAKLDDPQSLNLYAYVRNKPTVLVDIDGHCAGFECLTQANWVAQHQIGDWMKTGLALLAQYVAGSTQQQSQNLALFPTNVRVDPGSVTVDWRLRTSDGKSKPDQKYLVFEHLGSV